MSKRTSAVTVPINLDAAMSSVPPRDQVLAAIAKVRGGQNEVDLFLPSGEGIEKVSVRKDGEAIGLHLCHGKTSTFLVPMAAQSRAEPHIRALHNETVATVTRFLKEELGVS